MGRMGKGSASVVPIPHLHYATSSRPLIKRSDIDEHEGTKETEERTHRLVQQVDREKLALSFLVLPVTDIALGRDAGLDSPPVLREAEDRVSTSLLESGKERGGRSKGSGREEEGGKRDALVLVRTQALNRVHRAPLQVRVAPPYRTAPSPTSLIPLRRTRLARVAPPDRSRRRRSGRRDSRLDVFRGGGAGGRGAGTVGFDRGRGTDFVGGVAEGFDGEDDDDAVREMLL